MHPLDRIFEQSSRSLAQRTSRRSFVAVLGQILTGTLLLPLAADRPRHRAAAASPAPDAAPPPPAHQSVAKPRTGPRAMIRKAASTGNTARSTASCAPAAAAVRIPVRPVRRCRAITWIGTCHNPSDGRDYIVSYNDCCGKTSCGNCGCNRNEREKPMYRLSTQQRLQLVRGQRRLELSLYGVGDSRPGGERAGDEAVVCRRAAAGRHRGRSQPGPGLRDELQRLSWRGRPGCAGQSAAAGPHTGAVHAQHRRPQLRAARAGSVQLDAQRYAIGCGAELDRRQLRCTIRCPNPRQHSACRR